MLFVTKLYTLGLVLYSVLDFVNFSRTQIVFRDANTQKVFSEPQQWQ